MEEGVVYAARNRRQEPRGCHRQVVLRVGAPTLAQIDKLQPKTLYTIPALLRHSRNTHLCSSLLHPLFALLPILCGAHACFMCSLLVSFPIKLLCRTLHILVHDHPPSVSTAWTVLPYTAWELADSSRAWQGAS